MRNYLFQERGDLYSAIEARKGEIRKEIESQNSNYILNVNENDYIQYIYDKYFIKPIILLDEEISILEQKEIDIELARDQRWSIYNNTSHFIKGLSITFEVPFEGEEDLFRFRASIRSFNTPIGEINKNNLLLTYEGSNMKETELKQELERDLNSIKQHIFYANTDIEPFNKGLRNLIASIFSSRKNKLLKDMNLVSSLGIPLKKNMEIANTYVVPTNKKIINASKPVIKESKFKPEPALDMNTYNDIIEMLHNMVLVMERCPESFSKMDEESLRQHFLVQLNSVYEGKATGETFNSNGKTDILIREDGKNVFIGECKFWRGDQVFLDTIDQLLGYLCWRDTKAAILIFNRNKDFSSVLSKIEELSIKHKNFKKFICKQNETQFRYIYTQPNDINREVTLTIMAFDIPKIK